MPTTHRGSFSNTCGKARRLIFRRRTRLPELSKPTRWKVSFDVDADHREVGEVFMSLLRHPASPECEFA
jgi:hypothetical protein